MFIKTDNLTKIFHFSIGQQILSLGRVLLGRQSERRLEHRTVVAVDDVSLRVGEGERLGIIGRNGAGKTTLLQMIAGLSSATSGAVEVDGRVNCIMTLGVGLREDASGRENIYIDGEANGKSRLEIDENIDAIITFADIGEFIDHPMRTYSSGMKSRLSFAMIAFIEPEILIIDEALSAGDAEFGRKASAKMKEICDKGKILILVSHGLNTICDMCNRCIWMDHGRIRMDGDPETVTDAYKKHVRRMDEAEIVRRFRSRLGSKSFSEIAEVTGVGFHGTDGVARKIFDVGETMAVRIGVRTSECLGRPDLKISFTRSDDVVLMENLASEEGFDCGPIDGTAVLEIQMGPIFFGKNTYEVHVELLDRNRPDEPLLASYDSVLKVENPVHPHDNVAFFEPTVWTVESMVDEETA
ncbi:MAG: ATP-binding cassette domain-containing protein [Phycisphaerae bacterium]|nr:ATP-binding cassette domain-containing protein [Phycisphaerae bacterium]